MIEEFSADEYFWGKIGRLKSQAGLFLNQVRNAKFRLSQLQFLTHFDSQLGPGFRIDPCQPVLMEEFDFVPAFFPALFKLEGSMKRKFRIYSHYLDQAATPGWAGCHGEKIDRFYFPCFFGQGITSLFDFLFRDDPSCPDGQVRTQ